MDISDSEILILVGKIVGESNVKMESKTKIKVIVDDRVSVRSEVFEDLKSKLGNDKVKIEPHRVSSVDPIFVQKSARDKILIYFKSKSGGGSGLGDGGNSGPGAVVLRFPSCATISVSPGTNATATHPGGDKIATFTVSGNVCVSF